MTAGRFDLHGALLKRQEKLRSDLGIGDVSAHPGTKGDDTELNWLQMLRGMLPGRYGVSKGFVVDCEGSQSDQIDIVIHDCHFSPLLFKVGGALYIPAESVYAVFEVRQELAKWNMEYAANKVASVRRLVRTSVPIPHAGGVYAAIQPKQIIGGVLTRRSVWTPAFGSPFCRSLASLTGDEELNLGCAVEHGSFVLTGGSGDVEHVGSEVALIYFVMSLLRALQALATAPAIDYSQYLGSVR